MLVPEQNRKNNRTTLRQSGESFLRFRGTVARIAVAIGIAAFCYGSIASPGQSTPADAFKPIQADFESKLKVLQASDLGPENRFNADDVNTIVADTSEKIIKKLPPDDAPLIYYVRHKTPKPVDSEKVFVAKSEAESKFSALKDLLSKLSSLPSFQLDLTINTTPEKANFELIPPVGSRLSAATNTTLTNLYRGEYEYSLTKNGYKPVRGTIDFIERSGKILECELFSQSESQEALPCNLR